MAVSLVACGGGKDNEVSTSDTQQEETVNEESLETGEDGSQETNEAEGLQSMEICYGSNHYELFMADIHCPDGAYFDEDDVAKYEAGEMLSSVNVYDDVREYAAYVLDLASLEYYHDPEEAVGYGMLEQLYFDGDLREETAADYESYSQNVIDLGFQWEGKDVMLLETKSTMPDYPEQTDLFVCVEYERDFWRGKEGGGVEEHLHAPALFGFFMYSTGFEDLTVDQCAWIAGELFGVDSGRTWPEEGEESEEADDRYPYEKEIIGTWMDEVTEYRETFIFYEDGTGLYQCYDGGDYETAFTYSFLRSDYVEIFYEDGGYEGGFRIDSIDGDTMLISNDAVMEMPFERQ